jgi:hypothetical protein
MENENNIATVNAISKIEIPIDRGLIIKNIFIANEAIIRIKIEVIYNYENCTHSLNIKGLCARYTNLY